MEKTASEEWFIPWEEETASKWRKKGALILFFRVYFLVKNRYKVNMAFNTPCICRAAIILVTSLALDLFSLYCHN